MGGKEEGNEHQGRCETEKGRDGERREERTERKLFTTKRLKGEYAKQEEYERER